MGIIIRNTIKATAINYIGVIVGTISVLFVQTKVLSPAQIGEVRLILDKALLVLPLVMIGMDSVASRFYFHFENDRKKYGQFLTMLISLPLLLSAVALPFFYFFVQQHFWLITIVLLSNIYIFIIESYLNTKAKVAYPSFLRNVLFRLFYLTAVILYYFEIITFRGVLLAFTFWYVLHLVLLFLYVKKHLVFPYQFEPKFWDNKHFKAMMIFSFFLVVGASSNTLVTRLDTVMLEGITDSQVFVGLYTIGLSIAAFVELPKRPITQMAVPIISKDFAEGKIKEIDILYKKSAINLLVVSATLFSLIWINIDFIFHLIPNGETYSKGKYVVFFLGLARVIDLGLGINQEIIHGSKYYKWNLLLMPLLAITTIGLNYYFISEYKNATGAALATLIALVMYNLLRTFLVKWKLGLLPFTKSYFMVIPFAFLPFIIKTYALPAITEHIWIKMLIDSTLIILCFALPVYWLKLSEDINGVIDGFVKKYLKKVR